MRTRMSAGRCCCGEVCDGASYSDDFSTADAKWYLEKMTITGGIMDHTGDPGLGISRRCAQRPTLDGLVVSVQAAAYGASPDLSKVWIGDGNLSIIIVWEINFQFNRYQLLYPGGAGQDDIAGPVASGDILKLVLTDTSSGAGTYKAECYVNGGLIHTRTGISYTFDNPFHYGLIGGPQASFDDLEFASSL